MWGGFLIGNPPHTLLFCSKVPYSYVGCIGESSSWHDAVSKPARNHEAANWYISSWASDCTFTGVRSDNPYEDSDNPEDKFSLDTAHNGGSILKVVQSVLVLLAQMLSMLVR